MNTNGEMFPLPLTPFERLMWFDDQSDYPMTYFVEWRLSGELAKDVFVKAVQIAVERHPLLGCLVEQIDGTPNWRCPHDGLPDVRFVSHGEPLFGSGEDFIDLESFPGLRIRVRQSSGETTVAFLVHHACADGVGLFQFLGDIAEMLTDPCGLNGQSRLPKLSPESLCKRGDAGGRRGGSQSHSTSRRVRGCWREFQKFFNQRSGPLIPPARSKDRANRGNFNGEPQLLSRRLSEATTRKLREVAAVSDASLNDLLLRDQFITLAAWNDEFGGPGDRLPIRILMPTNLRAAGDATLPASNVVGYTFLTRTTEEIDSPDELLDGIRADTSAIRHYRLGWMFVDSVKVMQRIRGLLPFFTRWLRYRCLATATQSHLGTMVNDFRRRAEPALIELTDLRLAPPVRPGTHVAWATYHWGSRLVLNLRCDPICFSSQDAEWLLDRYTRQLETTAAG